MKIHKYCLCFLFMCVCSFVCAQTAAEMDRLLEKEKISSGEAARFVLEVAGLLPPGVSGQAAENAAYDIAKSKGWITKGVNEKLSLQETAFLIMSAFQLQGGVLYTLAPGPRYAYREMVYRRLIQGRADPDMSVSGQRLLHIIDRTMSHSGGVQ